MLCPLNQAFPKIDPSVQKMYTNDYNNKYTLLENFTPEVYSKPSQVFNGVGASTAQLNEPYMVYTGAGTGTRAGADRDSLLLDDDEDDDSPPCYKHCPYCNNVLKIKEYRDKNDVFIISALAFLVYTLI